MGTRDSQKFPIEISRLLSLVPRMSGARLLSSIRISPASIKCVTPLPCHYSVSSTSFAQAPRMEQVEVDEDDVQKRLGKRNKERAKTHRFFRRKDWMIAGTCFGIVIGIYSYTIWAIQQEKFLDDFDMPEEIDRTQKG